MIITKHKMLKFTLYALVAYLFTVLQATPGLFTLWNIKPVLSLALAVSVATMEGEFSGGIFAGCVGLFFDFFSYNRFGYNGLMFFLCCVVVGLLIENYMRPTVLNAILFSFGSVVAIDTVTSFFRFFIQGYDGAFFIIISTIIPKGIYTAVTAAPIFWLVQKIHYRYEKRVEA